MIKAQYNKDQELLEGLLQADTITIQAVYDLALPGIIIWVVENRGTEADARDIFQEALLSLYKRLAEGDFSLTCQLKSYLRIMCRNLWMTRLRDNKKLSPLTEEEMKIRLDSSVLQLIEQTEKRKLFLKYFDLLETGCKQILSLFFQKTPIKTIAKQLNSTENYIKKRKFLCKERLIKAVQNDPLFKELVD